MRKGDAASLRTRNTCAAAPWIAQGQAAEVTCAELPGHGEIASRVQVVEHRTSDGWEYIRATVAVTDPPGDLRAGMIAVVRIMIPMAELEPFRSLPSDPPRRGASEPRTVLHVPGTP